MLFELYNNLPITNPWYKFAVNIPTYNYKNKKNASLKEIAEVTTGSIDDWRIIWAVNIKLIKNPSKVDANVTVKIPAKAANWEKIPLDVSLSSVVALKVYGDEKYDNLVKKYMDVAIDAGLSTAWVPIFSQAHKVEGLELKD